MVGTAAGVLGGAGGVVAVLVSPLPVLVLGGLAFLVWLPAAVVVLVAALSRDPLRSARASAVLDRLLTVIPGSRPALPVTSGPPASPPAPVPEPMGAGAVRLGSPQRPTT